MSVLSESTCDKNIFDRDGEECISINLKTNVQNSIIKNFRKIAQSAVVPKIDIDDILIQAFISVCARNDTYQNIWALPAWKVNIIASAK